MLRTDVAPLPGGAPVRDDRRSLALLAASGFTVALGYGVILPIVPMLLERIGGHASGSAVSWHAGALSALYMLAVFIGAPMWGYVSDRSGRRIVIIAGLAGYVIALGVFALARSVWLAYLARALAGAFVSAVLPVASAYIADDADEQRRARSFALLGAASLFGFLVGPAFSGWVYALARGMGGSGAMVADMVAWPLYAAVGFGLMVLAAVYFGLPEPDRARAMRAAAIERDAQATRARLVLLALNFLAMFGLGALEVALPLLGTSSFGFDPARVAMLFAECSLMMMMVQGVLFFAPLLKRVRGSYLLALGFTAMALGFVLLGQAPGYPSALVAVGLIASGSGLLLPAISFIASVRAVTSVGALLGALTAAGSLGQAMGSAAGGWLYGSFSAGTFWVAGILMVIGVLASASGGHAMTPPVALATGRRSGLP
jgi:MFS family permease